MTGPALLAATSITKSYAAVRALSGVSFDLHRGEVHALVGENGAGKSTLIKIITGAVTPDSGTLAVSGQPVLGMTPALARSLGIAAIYQQPSLFAHLTIAENIAIALEARSPWRRVDWKRRRRDAADLLSRVGAAIDPDRLVESLSMPEQQLVEIAKAIGGDARILIMDEPTASLSEREVERLFHVIERLRSEHVGIIYISHRLEEILSVADRVTVLRDGQTIGTLPREGLERSRLINLMIGRELSAIFPKHPSTLRPFDDAQGRPELVEGRQAQGRPERSRGTTKAQGVPSDVEGRAVAPGEVAMELRHVSCKEAGVHDITLAIRSGEILGLAGLVGSGRTELAKTLFGLTPADSGELMVHGKPVRVMSPAKAIEIGIGYLPEDRRRHGVMLEMGVAENVSLASLNTVARAGLIDRAMERRQAQRYVEQLRIKTPSVWSEVESLSGGNQQKVALARWLAMRPSVLILDEPTQGVDVGSKSEIHGLMQEMAERGIAILMISSELPEILGMSDRIAVMRSGTIAGVLSREEASQEKILALAVH